MNDPYENTSESSAEAAKAMMETSRQYKSAISVPVFGKIPLSLSDIISDLKVRENPPLWAQFFKYVVFGFLATAVLLGVYFFLSRVFGGYVADDLPKETLKSHLARVMFVAFLLGSVVAYVTNRMFVFTASGRHWTMEFIIFVFVSGVSFYAGNFAKDWFIDEGLHKDVAALSFAVSSALVNFVARKYLVFSQSSADSNNSKLLSY